MKIADKQIIGRVLARLQNLIVVVATVGLLGACSAEMMEDADMNAPNGMADFVTAFGNLDAENYTIMTDAGVRLNIVELGVQTSEQEVAAREGRVMFNYSILGNSLSGGFDVKLNRFYPLVVKDMRQYDAEEEHASEATRTPQPNDDWLDEDFVSILEAPYMPYEVSIGGGCINVNVYYFSTENLESRTPEVELYYDTEASTEDTAVMQLVGREYEDMFTKEASMRNVWFSFRVTEEIEEKISEVGLYAFYWCWWVNVNDRAEGVTAFVSLMSNDTIGGSSSGRTVRLNGI